MTFPTRCAYSLVCLIAFSFTACDSSKKGVDPVSPDGGEGVQGQGGTAPAGDGKLDMSAQAATIHRMTTEMVNLMDDVSTKKIMNPPLKVSDVRNALLERVDWLDDMSAEDVNKLKQATANLDALIAEIRTHENAKGDAALEARLKKIEDWNRSIQQGLPK